MWPFANKETTTENQLEENLNGFSQELGLLETTIKTCVSKGESTEQLFQEVKDKNPELYKSLSKEIMGGVEIKENDNLPSPDQLADKVGVECVKKTTQGINF